MVKTRNKKHGKSGFTLLELLIVLIILGILAVSAIPYYEGMQNDAKIAVTKGTLAAIRGGIELAHAKILVSGANTGVGGANPDWPTFAEVRANRLILASRPASIRDRIIVRHDSSDDSTGNSLPSLLLPDMPTPMASNAMGVARMTLADIQNFPRSASETTGWAYYPGDEKDENGRIVSALFYINDDRSFTDNIDGADRVPSSW